MGLISFRIWKIWAILLLALLYLKTMPVAAYQCTLVNNIKVVKGKSAELYCHINHTNNDPNKTDVYSKTWTKRLTGSGNENVYVHIVRNQGKDTLKDEAGDSYKNRVQRSGDDVVRLSNVTEADYGTYGCEWTVVPDIPECSADNKAEFTLSVIGDTTLSAEPASAVSGPGGNYTISGYAVGDDLSTSDVDWKCQVNDFGVIRNATYNVKKTVRNSRATTIRKTVTIVATVVCPCSTEVINTLQVTHPARDGRIIEAQPVIVKCGNCSECCTTTSRDIDTTIGDTTNHDGNTTLHTTDDPNFVTTDTSGNSSTSLHTTKDPNSVTSDASGNSSTSASGTASTTVNGTIDINEQTIHVPAVTLLVLASVTIIASVVLIVFVVHFALACKNKNGVFPPKMWLFVVFGVVAIIIGVTFIAIGSIDLHSNGSVGVSLGTALCVISLIMDIFFIIGFIKHKIKGGLVAPFCSTTKKDVTSNGTKKQQAASRDSSAVKEHRATPQDISLQGNPNKGGNYNLTDEEKGSNPQFPLIDTSKMIHTDKPRKLPPLPSTHLPSLDEGITSPRKKKKKKAKHKSQEGED